MFQEHGSYAIAHDVLENIDGIEQSQFCGPYDCHECRNVVLALSGHISESDFSEKHGISNTLFRKIIRWTYSGIFQENEEFIFMGNQPLADVVSFMVRNWGMLVQFPESLQDFLSGGTVYLGSQNGMLIMQKYSVFKELFDVIEKCFRIGFSGEFLVQKLLDVPQNMSETFLLGKGLNLVPVGVSEIADESASIEASEMVDDNLGTPAFINMKESDLRVCEYPEPVPFPSGFVGMNERSFGERSFQRQKSFVAGYFGFQF